MHQKARRAGESNPKFDRTRNLRWQIEKNTLLNYFISILILFIFILKIKANKPLQNSIIKYTNSSSPFHLSSSSACSSPSLISQRSQPKVSFCCKDNSFHNLWFIKTSSFSCYITVWFFFFTRFSKDQTLNWRVCVCSCAWIWRWCSEMWDCIIFKPFD